MTETIERIILAIPKSDVSKEQVDSAIEAGRLLISAIPGVELISFGTALAPDESRRWYVRIRFRDEQALEIYKTHPNHTTFGVEQWLPIVAEQIVTDYRIQY